MSGKICKLSFLIIYPRDINCPFQILSISTHSVSISLQLPCYSHDIFSTLQWNHSIVPQVSALYITRLSSTSVLHELSTLKSISFRNLKFSSRQKHSRITHKFMGIVFVYVSLFGAMRVLTMKRLILPSFLAFILLSFIGFVVAAVGRLRDIA